MLSTKKLSAPIMQMFSLGRTAVRASSLAGLFWGASTVTEEKMPTPSSANCPIQFSQPEQLKGDVLLSRKIVNHLDKSGLHLRLYQYETCPFCCKVRAFLDYYGFSYEVVEVNPVTRKQINFSVDYKKVPIVRVNHEKSFTESSLIISQLATYINRPDRTLDEIEAMYPVVDGLNEKGATMKTHPNKYFVMLEKVQSDQHMAAAKEEREWREWVDDHFIHLISPNVYRTWEEALETFRWFDQVGDWHRTFPSWERCLAVYVGAAAMYGLSKRLKKRHCIEDERKALKDACDKWTAALGPNRKFMGGDKPNLADLALYGSMNSFYGTRAFKEVIANGGRISEWFAAVHKLVTDHCGRAELERRFNVSRGCQQFLQLAIVRGLDVDLYMAKERKIDAVATPA